MKIGQVPWAEIAGKLIVRFPPSADPVDCASDVPATIVIGPLLVNVVMPPSENVLVPWRPQPAVTPPLLLPPPPAPETP